MFQDAEPLETSSISQKGINSLRPTRRVRFLPEGSPQKKRERKPSLGVTQPSNPRRYLGKRATGSQRCRRRCEKRWSKTQRRPRSQQCHHRSHLRKSGVSLCNQKQEKMEFGKGFQGLHAHAELEGSTCSRAGNCTSIIHNPNGSPHDYWRSAHERGSNSVCQICGFIREKCSSSRITPPVLSLGQLCEDQRFSCE